MKIINIKWDTEDNGRILDIQELGLPTETEIPDMEIDEIADYLSDIYGWCVESFNRAMPEGMYEKLAHEFIVAIEDLANKEDNRDNLESYLSHHFGSWLETFANTPEGLVKELKHFANM